MDLGLNTVAGYRTDYSNNNTATHRYPTQAEMIRNNLLISISGIIIVRSLVGLLVWRTDMGRVAANKVFSCVPLMRYNPDTYEVLALRRNRDEYKKLIKFCNEVIRYKSFDNTAQIVRKETALKLRGAETLESLVGRAKPWINIGMNTVKEINKRDISNFESDREQFIARWLQKEYQIRRLVCENHMKHYLKTIRTEIEIENYEYSLQEKYLQDDEIRDFYNSELNSEDSPLININDYPFYRPKVFIRDLLSNPKSVKKQNCKFPCTFPVYHVIDSKAVLHHLYLEPADKFNRPGLNESSRLMTNPSTVIEMNNQNSNLSEDAVVSLFGR